MSFGDVNSSDGELVSFDGTDSCHSRENKLLVIGDSISCGYGVEGAYPCTWSASTENVLDSYAILVAAAVDAEVIVTAWSGKGMVRNYGDKNTTSVDPMPIYYNRTLANIADSYWNPEKYQPDVVIVTLGSNDYSTTPHPSDEDFINGYINLLTQVKTDYPNAQIATLCEPYPGDHECENVLAVANAMDTVYIKITDDIYV